MLPKRRMLLNSDEKRKTLQNVAMARGRLKGALKNKNVSSDDNSDSDDSNEETQAKKYRMDTSSNNVHIMKLFDRSFDLARFRPDSSLYPVCRAWSKNQIQHDTPEPEVKVPRTAIKREYNPDILEQFINGDLNEITEMPRPVSADGMEPYHLEKAEPVNEIEVNQSSLNKDELIKEHLTKWKKIRESWIAHRKQYESKRYGTSFELLAALQHNE